MGDLTDHFDRSELVCSHCGNLGWGASQVEELEKLRVKFGYPMVLSSAWRCAQHPEEQKKTKPGPHFEGLAIDTLVHGERALKLFLAALDLGWAGFGVNQKGPNGQRFLHLDRMWWRPEAPRPTIWSY